MAQIRLVQGALGANANKVQIVHGIEGLHRWVQFFLLLHTCKVMKAKLAHDVQTRFKRGIAKNLPSFVRCPKSPMPGDQLYCSKHSGELTFLIYLQFHSRCDAFTLEVGYSPDGTWPEFPQFSPDDPERNGARRFRLRALSHPDEIKEKLWWIGSEPSVDNVLNLNSSRQGVDSGEVERQVEDAISELINHAEPYFQQIAKQKACK